MSRWFDVDPQGLMEVWGVKGIGWILREPIQNCFDEPGVTFCRIRLEPINGRRARAKLIVEDNAPEGFHDIRHAYTLFAHTRKREDPTKSGKWNLGEKLLLSRCEKATIKTTTGTVHFKADGTRTRSGQKTETGSRLEAILKITKKEANELIKTFLTFIPSNGIKTTLNGIGLPTRKPKARITATLPTEISKVINGERTFTTTRRKTEILVYEPLEGEKARIYELGLPIQETGDRWHYSIQQRVPLDIDRDHVRPKYLQDVRAAVLNELVEELVEEEASEKWVRDATADPTVSPEAIQRVATLRWGEKRLVASPGTTEEQREKALASGYRIVGASELSRAEWDQVREAGAVPSVESTFPSITVGAEQIPEEDWTPAQARRAILARRIARLLLDIDLTVRLIKSNADLQADYNRRTRTVRFNVSRLPDSWWEGPIEPQLQLIIHELGHHYGGHLSMTSYDGLAKIGARLALMAPEFILEE